MTDKKETRTARREQQMKQKKNGKKKNGKKKPLFKKILLIIGILILLMGIGVGSVVGYYIATAPDLDVEKLSDPFSAQVLDMNGDVFAELGDTKRTKIEYNDLPQVLIDAVTATEDARFFEHHGIDLRRLAGAVRGNIVNGFGSEGASTITHQVVEQSFLTPEKKLSLKIQEQWLALKLERKFSKEQILEMYLNKIFYGSGAYGVAKAAEIYFGKTDLHDLTLIEAAILAGLPQRPTAYNPYENPDLTEGRVDTVLKLMVRHGKITQQEADEAREVDITSLLAGKKPSSTPYEAFIQKVEDEVHEKVDGANIYTDGLKIHTTLDPHAQEYVEFLLTDSEDNPISYPDDELQAGMAVLDTKTGEIRAIGGSRNNEGIRGYNYAYNNNGRQAGSTIKPIVAYGPAIENNQWSTYHQINDDKPYPIAGTDKEIRNWNRSYQGWLSMRSALAQSLNVPAVKALEETGFDNAKKFAEGLGIEFANDQITIGDAIGGTQTSVTPLQLAGAFRAFGNEGIYNEPYAVTEVEFPNGQSVDLRPKSEAVMSDYTAYMITDMLKSAVTASNATGRDANIPDLPMAGKTGTTNLEGQSGANNSWFSGYTTNFTISIWTGYNENNKIIENTKVPHALFKHTMTELSKDIDTPDFEMPDSVVEVEVERGTNPPMLPSPLTPSTNIVKELFVKGHEPSKKSEKFDKLDPVSNLSAQYNSDNESINVSWDYSDDLDVSYEVSASVDGGEMKVLSTTEETSLEISDIEADAEYVIQVVVVSNEDSSSRSDPASVKVTIDAEEIPAVESLSASFDEGRGIIDVDWSYDGPPAAFEVDVNGQTQTVNSAGLEISGVQTGSYTITVTPIGTSGSLDGVRGDSRSVTQDVNITEEKPEEEPEEEPATEDPEPEEEPEPDPEPDPEPNEEENNNELEGNATDTQEEENTDEN